MRSSLMRALLALVLAGGTGFSEEIERILAVVDATPVLLSEVRALQRLKRLDREAALQALIDETLMLREASRLKEAAASVLEEQRAFESLVAGIEPAAAREDPEALRRIARRQTVILKYVELRFRPQLRVDEAELLSAYQAEYAGRPDAAPIESVTQELTARLASRALDRRIEAWVAELRSGARIRLLPEPTQP